MKIAVLKTASILSIRDLRRWRVDDEVVELPYRWSGGPKIFEALELPPLREDEEVSTYLRIWSNSECVVYVDGVPYHAYVRRLEEFPLVPSIRRLSIEVLARDLDGLGRRIREPELQRVALIERSRTLYTLATLLETLVELWRTTSIEALRREIEDIVARTLSMVYVESLDVERMKILAESVKSYDYFQWYNPLRTMDEVPSRALEIAGCRAPNLRDVVERGKEALRYLENEIRNLVERYGKRGTLHAVATTHLDFLWLWGRDVFERKLGSTMATLLLYAKRFPQVVVGVTSTHYVYELSRRFPKLFEELRKCFSEGKCVSLGGFWTEFDANLIDGESLARQFLYGQRILEKLVGVRAKISFLPDTFGFPPSLPQILRQSGIELFVVRKLSWNDTNRFPYKHFLWIGIDGSAIPAIFVDHISASLPTSIRDIVRVFSGVERYVDRMLYPYGYGDGGGGPSEEAVLKLEHASKLPTMPSVVHGELDKLIGTLKSVDRRLPKWFGELYLENHRGVYSVGLRIKEMIRRCVKMLKTLDALTVLATISGVEVAEELRREIRELWLEVLAHQFHDVLATTLSYDALIDAAKALGATYARSYDLAKKLVENIARKLGLSPGIALFNPHPWRFRTLVELIVPKSVASLEIDGEMVPLQILEELDDRRKVLVEVELPPLGMVVLKPSTKPSMATKNVVEARCGKDVCILENEVLRVTIDRVSGEIVSIYDKEANREVLKARSNRIVVCEDRARHWEGWNIDPDHRDVCFEFETQHVDVALVGPLRSCIEIEKKFRRSRLVQRVCLDRGSRIVWFFTELDWYERQHLVKTWFYIDVNTHEAWFETSFGAYPRPLHSNTSWEQAKFEVWTHRWIDASEHGYGVAILTFTSRGVSATLDGISVTLLRSPFSPTVQDVGRIKIVYALYPHLGDWRDARIQHLVREIDEPPLVIELKSYGSRTRIEGLEIDGGVVEGLKLHEDSFDRIVVRIFEGYGGREHVSIKGLANAKCFETNIVEDELREVECSVALKPFEIKNLVLEVGRGDRSTSQP